LQCSSFLFKERPLSVTEFVKWVLPFCSNIHTLKIDLFGELKDLHNEIARLKKLKDLHIWTVDPKEVTSVTI